MNDDTCLRIFLRHAIVIEIKMNGRYDYFMLKQTMASPVGTLYINIQSEGIKSISYDEPSNWEIVAGGQTEQAIYTNLVMQLEAYFDGALKQFDLPLILVGTPFQKRVWQSLSEVPYGEVVSYKDIAISAGSPKAVQAVGQANRANPIPIIIPCHRCVKSNGELGGYNGTDIDKKQYLLALETY